MRSFHVLPFDSNFQYWRLCTVTEEKYFEVECPPLKMLGRENLLC
jgi:hypothetical protein